MCNNQLYYVLVLYTYMLNNVAGAISTQNNPGTVPWQVFIFVFFFLACQNNWHVFQSIQAGDPIERWQWSIAKIYANLLISTIFTAGRFDQCFVTLTNCSDAWYLYYCQTSSLNLTSLYQKYHNMTLTTKFYGNFWCTCLNYMIWIWS